ncbi:hypothetical protein CGC53_01405 [Capnocytophaga leadbetteri]|uniref:Uncharacterized protein n=2 Tax=Capnocytophaga leadbetteri TaxID=327575 RepID=A0A250FA21_9FLAO|nr:hypothetical protein CGC53_01405 [Capnocytophaga leadbetteri]
MLFACKFQKKPYLCTVQLTAGLVSSKHIIYNNISVKVSYSRNAIHLLRQQLVEQHPLTDIFIYTKMKTENTNPATPTTQYCFPAEAVNDYFINPACVEDFAKTMRLYNQIVAEYFLEDGNIPYGIARGVNSLNAFIKVLSPYFTTSKPC